MLASHVIAPAPWVASRTSLTPASSVAARSRGTSIIVPVAYWTHPTATTDVRASIWATTSAVRSDSGRSSTNSTRHSPLSARRSRGHGDRREVRRHGDHLRSPRRRQQERSLAQQLASAGENRDAEAVHHQQSGRTLAEAVKDGHLVLVGHMEVAVARDAIEQVVHGVNGRVANQTQRGLVEIDALLQCGVVGALDQR